MPWKASRATEYRKAVQLTTKTTFSVDAISVLVEEKRSKRLETVSKKDNSNLYLPYKAVLETKRQHYPPSISITVTQWSTEVKLQELFKKGF